MFDTRNGRKFRMALYCLLFITVGFLAILGVPEVAGLYTTYVGALVAILGVYCGGNIGNKFVLTRPDTRVMVDRRTVPREPIIDPGDEAGPGPEGV